MVKEIIKKERFSKLSAAARNNLLAGAIPTLLGGGGRHGRQHIRGLFISRGRVVNNIEMVNPETTEAVTWRLEYATRLVVTIATGLIKFKGEESKVYLHCSFTVWNEGGAVNGHQSGIDTDYYWTKFE